MTQPVRDAAVAVTDATPLGDGVEARLRRADAALQRAQELEAEAAEKAARARTIAEEVDATAQAGEDDVRRAREDADQHVEQVVAEAQREAEEYVAAKRQRAEEHADEDVAEAEAESRDAWRRRPHAPSAHGRRPKKPLHAHGPRCLTHAVWPTRRAPRQRRPPMRPVSGPISSPRTPTPEPRRRSNEWRTPSAGARQRPREAAPSAQTAVNGTGELDEMTKAELPELADGMGLEVNSHQLKKELVSAIKRSAK